MRGSEPVREVFMRFHGLGPSRSARRRPQAVARATAKAFDAAGGRLKATCGRARTARLVRRTGLTMLGHRRGRCSCHAGRSSAMKLHENLPDRLSGPAVPVIAMGEPSISRGTPRDRAKIEGVTKAALRGIDRSSWVGALSSYH